MSSKLTGRCCQGAECPTSTQWSTAMRLLLLKMHLVGSGSLRAKSSSYFASLVSLKHHNLRRIKTKTPCWRSWLVWKQATQTLYLTTNCIERTLSLMIRLLDCAKTGCARQSKPGSSRLLSTLTSETEIRKSFGRFWKYASNLWQTSSTCTIACAPVSLRSLT